jgi:Lar family restriction alleviation protein
MEKGGIASCPFCGGKADEFSRYDSDDHRPDGEQFFVECEDCGAKGAEFYAVTTNETLLNKKEKEGQREAINNARQNAINAWNRRIKRE